MFFFYTIRLSKWVKFNWHNKTSFSFLNFVKILFYVLLTRTKDANSIWIINID